MREINELKLEELETVSGGCMGCIGYGLTTGAANGAASGAGGFSDAELQKAIDKLPAK